MFIFFFNDTATTEIYTLSLHDALPICPERQHDRRPFAPRDLGVARQADRPSRLPLRRRLQARHGREHGPSARSEEHTSELQSRQYLVCRLLLEKKQKQLHRARVVAEAL